MNKRVSLLLSVVLLVASFATACAQDTLTPAQQAAATAQLYGGATSISWALLKDGEVTQSGTLGADGAPKETMPLYGVGSVSKIYTTAAAMHLAESGSLALDEPITTYLPGFTMADARYEDITLRMLLNHSSGLMFAGMQDAFLFDDAQNRTAVDSLLTELSTQRLIADPGAYSVYNNTGFTLAQLVIEQVSGMSLGDYLRKAFLESAGLSDTYACSDDFDRSRLAPAYLPTDPTRPVAADTVVIEGTGGIYATAEDLARFGGVLCGQGKLLSEDSLAAMANDEYARGLWPEDSEDDALSFGLGWDAVHMFPFNQSGITALCKGGDTNFYHAALVVLPEYGMAAAVLSAGGVSTYNQLFAARLLIDALAAQGVQVDESASLPPAQPAQMPEALTALSGLYGTSTYPFDVVITEDGTLTLTLDEELGGTVQTLTYRDDGSFRDEADSVLVKLVTAENGEVYFFQKSCAALPGLTSLVSSAYAAQLLPENPLDEETQHAWQARVGKRYFLLNGGWSSQMYALGMPYSFVSASGWQTGYEGSNRIEDENHLLAVVNIPGTAGRDTMDMAFFTQDGLEYLTAPGYLYVEEAAVKPLAAEDTVTIAEDGYAQWFSVDASLADKTLHVTLPDCGSFAAYDADGLLLTSSAAYGDTEVLLQAGGYVVFAGEAGASFGVTVQ